MLKSVEDTTAHLAEAEVTPLPHDKRRVIPALRATVQIVLMFGILFGSFTLMQRMIANQPQPVSRPPIDRAIPVDTVRVSLADIRPSLSLFGEIVAGRTIEIRPAAGGEVTVVNESLAVGGRVSEGELLFSIDPFDLEIALAEAEANLAQTKATIIENRARIVSEDVQLENAREQLEFAQADYERALALRENGTLTAKQVEDRALLVSQRRQSVLQRENNITVEEARLEQQLAVERRLALSVERARRNMSDADIFAPFSGIVRTSNVEVGRQLSANEVAVSMYDDAALDVRFTLTDAQYGRVATDSDPLIGRDVDVTWRIGGNDYAYAARITRLGADVASERGGVDVFARIADASVNDVLLRPGAFVSLTLPDRLYPDSARVPEQAVFDGPSVFKVVDRKLVRQEVTVLAYDGDEAVIVGVEEGTELLATRLSNAENEVSVRTGDDQQNRQGGERPNSPRPNEG